MKKQEKIIERILGSLLTVFLLVSCVPVPVMPANEGTPTSVNTETAAIELPAPYLSPYTNPLDTPHTYLEDSCLYLINRWNRLNSEPGTVVMIIMLRDIITIFNEEERRNGNVDVNDLRQILDQLHAQGFEAIRTKQLLAFMERNVKIPPRSVLIIQDGTHDLENYDKSFREYWQRWGWPVVNGWVNQPNLSDELWEQNIALENEGFVDHQPQGVTPQTILTDDSSKVVIARELKAPITPFIEKFQKNPIAVIWPNGGFGQRTVTAARLLDYQLGFTTNSRGPVMYNWVPLADQYDPNRPTFIPEGKIGDPLMTLPRFWPHEALNAIDQVRIMGEEAKAYALANKDVEFEYYRQVCEPIYGQMPTP